MVDLFLRWNRCISISLIFRLPVLRRCLVFLQGASRRLSMSLAVDQFSSLEWLRANRHFSVHELLIFLSTFASTPSPVDLVSHKCYDLFSFEFVEWVSSSDALFGQTLAIVFWNVETSHLDALLRPANVSSVDKRERDHYLTADRCEDLIRPSMPWLRVFDLQHFWESVDNDQVEGDGVNAGLLSNFTQWNVHPHPQDCRMLDKTKIIVRPVSVRWSRTSASLLEGKTGKEFMETTDWRELQIWTKPHSVTRSVSNDRVYLCKQSVRYPNKNEFTRYFTRCI